MYLYACVSVNVVFRCVFVRCICTCPLLFSVSFHMSYCHHRVVSVYGLCVFVWFVSVFVVAHASYVREYAYCYSSFVVFVLVIITCCVIFVLFFFRVSYTFRIL